MNFDWLVDLIKCPYVLTTNCNLHKVQGITLCINIGDEHQIFGYSYPFSSLTNLPMVGIVVTISPSLSLYRIVVLPAASNPTKIKERLKKIYPFLKHEMRGLCEW